MSTCASSPGAGAAGGLAGGLAAIGADLEPGFDVVADAAGLEDALDDVDLVVTGEGKLDATSFDGKTVGGVLDWAADAGVPHIAVIAGQVTPEAREELAVRPGVQVLALTDRVWQGGEAFARAATLVEEAALEAARKALGLVERVAAQTPSTQMKLPVAAPSRTAFASWYSGEWYQRRAASASGNSRTTNRFGTRSPSSTSDAPPRTR